MGAHVHGRLRADSGMALDEKTPLHRAEQALAREGKRLFKLLGHDIDGLHTNIGLERTTNRLYGPCANVWSVCFERALVVLVVGRGAIFCAQ